MHAIRLTHPEHGEKFAYLEEEAKIDEKNGWVREEEKTQEPRPIITLKRGPGRPRKDE